jgi:hypothetical protein
LSELVQWLGCWPGLQGLLGKVFGYYDPGSMPGCMMQLAHHSDNIRRLSQEHGLGDHADDTEAVFFILPLPLSRLVHCCLDSRGVLSYSLAACAFNTTMDCCCDLTIMDCCYLQIRIAWHGLGWPKLAQTPMLPSVALLYQPPMAQLPLDLSTFSSCLITIQCLHSPRL